MFRRSKRRPARQPRPLRPLLEDEPPLETSSSEQTQHASFDTQWWLDAQRKAPVVPKILIVPEHFVEDTPEAGSFSCSSSMEDYWAPRPSHNHNESSPDRNSKKQVTFDLDAKTIWSTPSSVSSLSKPAAASRRKFFRRRRSKNKHDEESSETGSETSSLVTPLPPPSTNSKPTKSVLKVKTAGPFSQESATPLLPRVKATSLFVGEDVKATPLLVGMMPSIREDGNDDVDGSGTSSSSGEEEGDDDDNNNNEAEALCCAGSERTGEQNQICLHYSLSDLKVQGEDGSFNEIIENEWGNIEVKLSEGLSPACDKNLVPQKCMLQDNAVLEQAPSNPQEINHEGFSLDSILIADKIFRDAGHDQSFETSSTADLSFGFAANTSQDESLNTKEWTEEIRASNSPVLVSEADNNLDVGATDLAILLGGHSIDEVKVLGSVQLSNVDVTAPPIVSSLLRRDGASIASNRGTKSPCKLLQGISGKTSGSDIVNNHLEDHLGIAVKVIEDINDDQAIPPMDKQALKKKTLDFFSMFVELPRRIVAFITLQLILLKISVSLNEEAFI